MSKIKNNKTLYLDNTKIIWAYILLFIGSMIYLSFRSTTLLLFEWCRFLGLDCYINFFRSFVCKIQPSNFIIYNLPGGMWLLSYMLLINVIWANEKGNIYYRLFLYSLPIITLYSEVAQLFSFVPGTFDILDIICYLFAIIFFYCWIYEKIYIYIALYWIYCIGGWF